MRATRAFAEAGSGMLGPAVLAVLSIVVCSTPLALAGEATGRAGASRAIITPDPATHPAGEREKSTTIAVNCGPFASAKAAGRAEGEVNWRDGDTRDDTACTECFAALELQRYLRRMTSRGSDFAVVDDDALCEGDLVLVGAPLSNALSRRFAKHLGLEGTDLGKLGPEGYRIKSAVVDGRRITLIAGGGRVGTLYAAYDLLHRLGCRWFAPGDIHEDVPRDLREISAMDVTERPDFQARGFLSWENRAGEDFLLWMACNRLNYWCVEQDNHPLMHKLGIRLVCGLHDAPELFLHPAAAYPYRHPRFLADQARADDPYPTSPQYQGDTDKDGRLSYFEAHPEWFAEVKGRRVPGFQAWSGTNYCTSNQDATTEFMKNYVRALVDGSYRDADMVRFWLLDGGRWCECAECKALGTPTDRNLLLVDRFLREIEKARSEGKIHRPIEITFLAYADVLEPPTRPLPAGFRYDLCAATFYPIRRCYVHNFDEPTCPANERYRRELAGWATDPARHYRGEIAIGEYYNVSRYKSLPLCFMHTMAHDIPVYYKAGARQFDYMHVTTRDWGNKALTNYQMARQIWDVDTDCEALWQDYFARRYGAAAAIMRRFYESLERMFANVTELKYGLAPRLERGDKDLFPTPHLRYRREPGVECDAPTLAEMVESGRQCRLLLTEAMGMDLTPSIRERIEEDERLYTYGERTLGYYDACVQAFQLARAGRVDEARRPYSEAVRLADLLRQDTRSTATSSAHANAPDALAASLAPKALDHLAGLLDVRKAQTPE